MTHNWVLKFCILQALIISSCATHINRNLDFSLARSVALNARNTKDVIEILGKPSETKRDKQGERWQYYESAKKYQRLTMNFDLGGNLKNVLWLPLDEAESNWTTFQKINPKSKFALLNRRVANSSDSISSYSNYTDRKLMTILVHDPTDRVDAIAWILSK